MLASTDADDDDDISWLELKLKAVVADEDYESAARIKGRIDSLRASGAPSPRSPKARSRRARTHRWRHHRLRYATAHTDPSDALTYTHREVVRVAKRAGRGRREPV